VNSGRYCHTPGHLGSKCRQRNSGRKSKSIPRAHLSRALSCCKHPTHPVTYTRHSISTSGDFPSLSPPARPSIPSIDDDGLRGLPSGVASAQHRPAGQVGYRTAPKLEDLGDRALQTEPDSQEGPWRNPTCIPHHLRAPDRRPNLCVCVYISIVPITSRRFHRDTGLGG
jgi:hypothetical protein